MRNTLLIIIALIILMLTQGGIFVINEAQQGIVTQFGKPISGLVSPGLHFKLPFVQKVRRFENRILKWDGDPNEIPTKDKKYIWIDTTARWRINDPLLFFKTVATELGAHSRLDDIIDSVVRDAVSGHLLVELVRGKGYEPSSPERFEVDGVVIPPEEMLGREEILAGILERASSSTPEYGIELLDVQIKRINYSEGVLQQVYKRMINERKKVAAQYRSEGEGEKAETLGKMQRELKEISSEAYRKALEVRGSADAEAASIYADAYNRDREFYVFLRTLESYKKTVGKNGRMIISTDADYYKYLKEAQ